MDASREIPGVHRVEQIMGMPIGIDLRDASVSPDLLDWAFDWFRWVDATFSPYRDDSEISTVNAGTLNIEDAHESVREVLAQCEELRVQTDGFFDIRTSRLPVPIRDRSGHLTSTGIDPSGLVKGWAVDRAAQILHEAGACNFCINAGGDLHAAGAALPDETWRIGIRHPLETGAIAQVVDIYDGAIATSGAYERGQHIINPHTGQPPEGVLSVSITGRDLATADAYATAAFAMGVDGPQWTAQLFGYEAMTILADQNVVSTRWFPLAREAANP